MTLNNQDYWNKRAEAREKEWYSKSEKKLEKQIRKIYLKALKDIQEKLNALYGKYADENDLTMQEARKLISGSDYTVWRMDIEDYVKQAETNSEILKELNTLAMRSRISRLDKLRSEILMALQQMGESYEGTLDNYLGDALKDSYYHATFDIAKGINMLFPVAELSKEVVKDILREPWSGKRYSSRIWDNTKKLAGVLKNEIVTSMIRGTSAREMSENIARKMDSSYKQALTLVRTELNYVNNQGSLKAIDETGGEEYRYVATLDSRTSQICRRLDGTIHRVKDGSPGTNMPPMHPRCRSTITVTTGTANAISKRISKVNGKTQYVPANMNYSDWEKVYVKKTITLEEWQQDYKLNAIGQRLSKQLDKLSSEEKEAITYYTGNGAQQINMRIAMGWKISPKIQHNIDLLDSALAKGVITDDIIVTRKTIPEFLNYFKSNHKITVDDMINLRGEILHNDIYTSTALKDFDYGQRNVVISLKVLKGTKGALYIRNLAVEKYKNQFEILFHRELYYIIKEINYENGIYYIKAEVVNNEK